MGGAFSVYASHWMTLIIVGSILSIVLPSRIGEFEAFMLYLLKLIIAFGVGLLINKLISCHSLINNVFTGGRK